MTSKRFLVSDKRSAEAVIIRNGGRIAPSEIRTSILGNSITRPAVIMENPGLKILGAIDFLVNYHGYKWQKENS